MIRFELSGVQANIADATVGNDEREEDYDPAREGKSDQCRKCESHEKGLFAAVLKKRNIELFPSFPTIWLVRSFSVALLWK